MISVDTNKHKQREIRRNVLFQTVVSKTHLDIYRLYSKNFCLLFLIGTKNFPTVPYCELIDRSILFYIKYTWPQKKPTRSSREFYKPIDWIMVKKIRWKFVESDLIAVHFSQSHPLLRLDSIDILPFFDLESIVADVFSRYSFEKWRRKNKRSI